MASSSDDKALSLTREELQEASGEILTLQDRLTMAKLLQQSGYFPDVKSTAQAFAKIQAGHELGIGPMTALREVNILPGGRPTLSAHLMAVLVMRSHKYQYRVIRSDAVTCILAFDRRESRTSPWTEMGQEEFSMDMARRAKIYEREEGANKATLKALADKWNYQSWAADMLFARTMTRGAKKHCAEGFGGAVYLPDEIADDEPEVHAPVSAEQVQQTIADVWGDTPAKNIPPTVQEHPSQTPQKAQDAPSGSALGSAALPGTPEGLEWRGILTTHLADLPEPLHEQCVAALGNTATPEGEGLALLQQVLDVLDAQAQETQEELAL